MRVRITYRRLFFVGCLLLTLVLTSCGAKEEMKLFPVTGKVLLNDKPTEGALVMLHAQDGVAAGLTQPPRAYVKADGSFTIGTLVPEDGAPPGDYKVTVQWLPKDARAELVEGGASKDLVPLSYGDPRTSGLQIKVKEEPNEVPVFQLKAKGR